MTTGGALAADRVLDLVTGGFSYTGGFILRELLRRGRRVRTMTGRAPGPDAPEGVEAVPYAFHDPASLRRSLQGVHTVYNTYWIRFPRGGLAFRHAVDNTRLLLEACVDAGVDRFVHISVSNASLDSTLPYYRAKAETERWVQRSGVPWRIVRPTLIVGPGDILVNNIAWLLRRSPLFMVPGDGAYRLQPVVGQDVARIAVDAAGGDEEVVRDAAGPETLPFVELVHAVARAVGARARVVTGPAGLAMALCRLAGLAVRDVILTRDELEGLRQELLVSHQAPLGTVGFTPWLKDQRHGLGRRYASELDRHYRRQASA